MSDDKQEYASYLDWAAMERLFATTLAGESERGMARSMAEFIATFPKEAGDE